MIASLDSRTVNTTPTAGRTDRRSYHNKLSVRDRIVRQHEAVKHTTVRHRMELSVRHRTVAVHFRTVAVHQAFITVAVAEQSQSDGRTYLIPTVKGCVDNYT